VATRLNCGDLVKHPSTKLTSERGSGQANPLGMVTAMGVHDYPQPSSVGYVPGEGSETKQAWVSFAQKPTSRCDCRSCMYDSEKFEGDCVAVLEMKLDGQSLMLTLSVRLGVYRFS
jgi:hypothetical protein